MKFCDKLPKLRKENNLSQELLADRLKVSRQAVSKWESGSSYPDMEKMIQLCSILNCTLEDLMDDGTIGNNNSKGNKFNLNNYLNDFLKYITKTYNMFCSMKFKSKIKCLLEMAFIAFILFLIGLATCGIIDYLIFDLLLRIPTIGTYINIIANNVLTIIITVIGIIAFLHLFKIRYLDYYVTIEDKNTSKKTIEEPIEKSNLNNKQEKIIIRDPKHSSFSFFNGLATIVVFFIKIFVIFIGSFFILSFIGLVCSNAVLIYLLKYGCIFFGLLLSFIGILGINYLILEFCYNFICNRKHHFKRSFIIFISSLILTGLGIGITFTSTLNFKHIENTDIKQITDTKYIEFNKNTKFYNYDKVIIDNNQKNMKLEIIHSKDLKYIEINNTDDNNYHIYYDDNTLYTMKLILNDIKKQQLRDYEELQNITIKLYISKDNYNQLIKNNNTSTTDILE